MALQLVTGSGGKGKTDYVWQEMVKEAAAHPERRYFAVVPEQYTLQTQKLLVSLHPSHCIMNIDVLSFNRLALRVFEELGINRIPILEDIGKGLVLQKMILDNRDSFGVLKRTLARTGAAEQMKSLISELMQYRVRPSDLAEWENDPGCARLLKEKLADIRLVYEAFEAYLKEKYLMAEEVPEVLGGVIEESEIIRDSTVVFDGFTGFVPSQLYVLEKLLKLCRKVTVTLTVGTGEPVMPLHAGSAVFGISRKTCDALLKLAEKTRTEILPEIRVDTPLRMPEMDFLERNLFRYTGKAFQQKPEAVFLTEADNPKEEMERTAQIIRRYLRQGLRYRDFAVIAPDLSVYGRIAASVFGAADIPCFVDEKNDVMSNTLTSFTLAAFALATENYSYAAVTRFLRSGLSSFTAEETDLFETYVLACGIKGRRKYAETWERPVRTLTEEERTRAEVLRERFVSETKEFLEKFSRRGSTVRDKCAALYGLFLSENMQEKLKEREDSFTRAEEPDLAAEYARIFPAICGLMDRMVEIMGEEKVSAADFARLFEAGLAELKLGYIPPGKDKVLVGDLTRTRCDEVKVLFLCGLNEGQVPKPSERTSLLSDQDREELEERDILLADNPREDLFRQRFYLYLMLTKPEERLYLSCSRNTENGQSLLPSSVAGTVKALFPLLTDCEQDAANSLGELETPAGREKLLQQVFLHPETYDPEGAAAQLIRDWLADKELSEKLFRMAAAAGYVRPDRNISPETAGELYGGGASYSPTRLETYAACAFAHFLKYGLRLKEREEFDFTGADFGSVLHKAIELFSSYMKKEKLSWRDLDEEKRISLADRAFDEALVLTGREELGGTGRGVNLVVRMREMLQNTVWAVTEQIKKGSFEPLDFEIPFRQKGIMGTIDRLDTCTVDGKEYLRVVDYKSGKKELDLAQLYYGRQLQLPLYLSAAMTLEELKHKDTTPEPAGLYYFPVDNPILTGDDPDEVKTEADFLQAVRLKGLSRSEREILRLLDNELENGGVSGVMEVKLNNDGSPPKNSKAVADGEDFAFLNRYTRHIISKMEGEIAEGRAEINPGGTNKDDYGCRFCPFGGVCGYDAKIPGYHKRKLKSLDRAEALDKMRKALEKGGTDGDHLE